jgi:hypothetical protein
LRRHLQALETDPYDEHAERRRDDEGRDYQLPDVKYPP